jgi:TetR/AcrR family transcriptional regulator, transcriptional repressor of bet genes
MTRKARTRIEDLRRIELIDAAHRVFIAHGLGGMTTARICAEAGMSPGILSYYFKGKDEVLYAMVRQNNRALAEDVLARLREAGNRWDRLVAIVEGNFPAAYFHQNVANAWLSVCAAASGNPRYARLQRLFHCRLASNIGSTLAGVVPAHHLPRVILSIGVQIDGLWLRKSADPNLSRDDAVQLILASLDQQLSPDLQRTLKARPA